VRTGLRAASRSQEADLLSRARRLKKDPELVLPKCSGECRKCPFDKARRNLGLIAKQGDDKRRLMALASRGDELEKAFAATLLIAIEGKAPVMAPFKTPHGTTTWIKRGKAKREMLVGVQHYDDPYWRIFAIADVVRKNRIHVYSTAKGLICTGVDPAPPGDFVDDSIRRLRFSLKRAGDLWHCPHLAPSEVNSKEGGGKAFLRVDWDSAERSVAVCQSCAKKHKESTFITLVSRIAARDVGDDFDFSVVQKPRCKADCRGCIFKDPPPIPADIMEQYEGGALNDAALIDAYLDTLTSDIEASGELIYMHDDQCFGKNLRRFVRSLEPANEDEETALLAALKKDGRPKLLGRSSAGRLLMDMWDEYAMTALVAVSGDKAVAKEVLRSEKAGEMTATQLVREAAVGSRRKRIIGQLPSYEGLPEVAAFADEVARLYRSHGEEDVIRHVNKYRGGDTHAKSSAYAVLLALGKGEGKKWQYTQTEQDFANFLIPYIRELLDADAAGYHDALQNVLGATGSVKKIEPLAPSGDGGKKKKKKGKKKKGAGTGGERAGASRKAAPVKKKGWLGLGRKK